MAIETTVMDFNLSKTFAEYKAVMTSPKMNIFFASAKMSILYIGVNKDDPQRATVIFQAEEGVTISGFNNPAVKPIVESTGHIHEGTIITRWIS